MVILACLRAWRGRLLSALRGNGRHIRASTWPWRRVVPLTWIRCYSSESARKSLIYAPVVQRAAATAAAEFPRAFRFSRVHVIIIFHSSIPLPLGDIVLRACVGFTWVNAAQVSVINCHRAGSRGAVINFERMMESLSFSSSQTSSLLAPIYGRVSLSSDAAVGERLSEE